MFFRTRVPVSTDPRGIEALLTRGTENVIPRALAEKKLHSGERLRVYFGVDPTGTKLHLGHSVPLRKLDAFAKLGHHVILVVGSFTAMIGDPTDRDAARAALARAEVEANFKEYKRQAGKVLDMKRVEVRYNHEWLDTVDFEKIVSLASKFTVQHMLQRDMFVRRLKEQKPIALHEFLYPLMVGYDSVVLDVDCELGGSDQEFNMLAGRTLQAAFGKRDKFVLTTPLIEGTDGRKMSKTYQNAVYLDDAPGDMFGKLMSVKDELMSKYFETLTDIPEKEITRLLSGHPKEAKVALATELVRMYHGEQAAKKAAANFDAAFSNGGAPDTVPELSVGASVAEALLAAKLVSSKTDLRRLLAEGAVKAVPSEEKISDIESVGNGTVLRIGKHRFAKIIRP